MDFVIAGAGFLVGLVVGLTGVGGGALMTPFLVFYGIAPVVAVGTDLVYAAITKLCGVVAHHRKRTIHWPIVGLLALGSLPGSAFAVMLLDYLDRQGVDSELLITVTLGVSRILTSIVIFLRVWGFLGPRAWGRDTPRRRSTIGALTVLVGGVIGVMVTLSSVGAGALGAAALIVLYPRLRAVSVVGTDIAHAVFIAAISGAGHLHLGTVDFLLLVSLLLGSIPGICLGTQFAQRLPQRALQGTLGAMLFSVGLAVAF